ncbi:hypothetical protein BU56_27880 [Escherichia coli O145:H25 str. 07-3858]|nr:hypothetical protein BU56_27880 [Escherichia coli O145:H25 str. 07-3858]
MLAGGIGNIRADHVQKGEINVGAKLVVLGGPAMNIGLGGGAASSMASGQSDADLDFASVQRGQPGDGASLPGSDRPLLAAWVMPTQSCLSTTSALAVFLTRCRNW